MGFFIMLVTALAFTAGSIRNELALTLLGTVFLTILAYCFLGTLLLGLIHRRRVGSLSMAIIPDTVNVGGEAELVIKTDGSIGIVGGNEAGRSADRAASRAMRFRGFPAILVRCELRLKTKDGRVIRHFARPGANDSNRFPVMERGAFYGEYDKLLIFDAPGFFSLALPIYRDKNPRLLAVPRPAVEPVFFPLKPGGAEERSEPHYRKSDEFIDHRPYVPGDDPRRINWKLYSHAPLGELFVREGENEPPPHSRLLILIDGEVDGTLFAPEEGRLAVDLLCENALAAALDFSGRGMDISVGWTGGEIIGAKNECGPLNPAELAAALAWPAAVSSPSLPEAFMPNSPGDGAVLILALPRAYAGISSHEVSALDCFLKNREAGQEVNIAFLYDTGSRQAAELEEYASVCIRLYNGRTGIHAVGIPVSRTREGAAE